jgi:phosphoglycolate phosphatase
MTVNGINLRNIFFDLDGTLVDTSLGVFRCYRYTFDKLDLPYPGDNTMRQFLGPSLREAFTKLLDTTDSSVVEKAVAIYRERYRPIGVFECEMYPGISDLLFGLSQKNLRLFVVTTKAKPYADIMVKHLGFEHWFTAIIGAGMDGRFDDKAEMIEYILSNFSLNAQETIMIGDRERDILAGKANNTRTMGVTYGYGSSDEIKTAQPDWICESPREIGTQLNHEL